MKTLRRIKNLINIDLFTAVNIKGGADNTQKNDRYLDWKYRALPGLVNDFMDRNNIPGSGFVEGMQKTFSADRFEVFIKKLIVCYLGDLFDLFYLSAETAQVPTDLILEDNPLNRYAAAAYSSQFKSDPPISWKRSPAFFLRMLNLFLIVYAVLRSALVKGMKMSNKVAEFKVMTEALRGLEDGYGRYGHDDFMVDGFKIKEQDLLLFTSNLPANGCRLKGYSAAKRSAYASFVLGELKINWNVFVSRVIPKYVLAATYNLAENIFSNEYSMFYSIYYHFAVSALAYERLFSNYRIKSELSYVYYSYRHVAEAIVCQNYGARHFILQYSDASVTWDNSQVAFLGCDKYLIWGDIHRKGCEGAENMIEPTGFIHKKAIREISCNRDQVLAKMGINRDGRKAIGFFDESFGHNVKLTETHYLAFWEIIVNTALAESETIILIKPKVAPESHQLSAVNRVRFAQLFAQLKECNNVFIIDPDKWSFIETIGVSDLVITEGMTSSATIALICGINGLYYDQANYQHPLALQFKGRLVFDDPKTLLLMIRKILKGEESALQQIPDDLLRAYDQYPDDRGIEVIRELLAC